MLKMDEYWYSKGKMVSTDTQRYKQPFQPGRIIEMTTHAPADGEPGGMDQERDVLPRQRQGHAKAVKAF